MTAACTPGGDEPEPTPPEPPKPIEKPAPGTKLAVATVIDPEAEFAPLDGKAAEDVYKQKKSDKRGISTNFKVAEMPDLLSFGVSWCYDWGSAYDNVRQGRLSRNDMVYAPMGWNGVPKESDLKSNRITGSEYLLGFNEPNLSGQAYLTPQEAAELWTGMVEVAAAADLKLVSPAMCWGTMPGYSDPEVWLDHFFRQPGVSLDQVDAIAGHAYMPNTGGVKAFCRKFAKYGKPFWLTEFCYDLNGQISNDPAKHIAFMSDIITYLEADPSIGKYAWFMDTGMGTAGGNCALIDWAGKPSPVLTPLGVLYNSASSLDKETHYAPGENIPAEHYSDSSATAIAAGEDWSTTVVPLLTTDAAGTLDIRFGPDCWVEYMVDVPADGTYRLDVRYATPRAVEMTLTTQWIEDQTIKVAASGNETSWASAGAPVAMLSGKQTIRLSYAQGTARINWLRLTQERSF